MAYGYSQRVGGMVRLRDGREAKYEFDKGLDFFFARAAGAGRGFLDVHGAIFSYGKACILAGKPDDAAGFSHPECAGHVAGKKKCFHGGFRRQVFGYDRCQRVAYEGQPLGDINAGLGVETAVTLINDSSAVNIDDAPSDSRKAGIYAEYADYFLPAHHGYSSSCSGSSAL
jgi:hypothetical protein